MCSFACRDVLLVIAGLAVWQARKRGLNSCHTLSIIGDHLPPSCVNQAAKGGLTRLCKYRSNVGSSLLANYYTTDYMGHVDTAIGDGYRERNL